MPDGSTPFPIGHGEAEERSSNLAEHYPFVVRELTKPNALGDDAATLHLALQSYHRSRIGNRVALIDGEDLDGFRCAVIKRDRSRAYFAGVRDDGRIEQVKAFFGHSNDEIDHKEIATQIGEWINNPDRRYDISREHDLEIEDDDWVSLSPRSSRVAYQAREAAQESANSVARHVEDKQGEDVRNAFFHRFSAQVQHSYRQRLGAASAHLMKHLDPEVQRTMRSTALYSPEYANWLTGTVTDLVEKPGERDSSPFDDEYEPRNVAVTSVDAQVGRNRRQAIAAFPALAKSTFTSAKSSSYRSHAREGTLGEVIDGGKPLLPALCSQHNVKPATMRRLQGMTWQKMGRDFFRDASKSLTRMDKLSLDHIPQSRRGCADLTAVADASFHHAAICDSNADETLRASGGRIDKIAQELEGNPAEGIGDLHKYLLHKLVGPGILQKKVAQGLTSSPT